MVHVFKIDPAAVAGMLILACLQEDAADIDADDLDAIEENLRWGIGAWEKIDLTPREGTLIGAPSGVVALHNALAVLKSKPLDLKRFRAILAAEFEPK